MDWFDDWALTLAVFLPAVGMAIVLLIPRAEESAIKVVALAHHAGDARRSASASSPTSTTTTPARLQFRVNEPWIDVINSRYHVGIDGISLPLLILSMLDHRAAASSTRGTTSPSRTTRRRSSR